MTTYKGRDACQKLLDLLALDNRYVIICDALASHEKQLIQEEPLEETPKEYRSAR